MVQLETNFTDLIQVRTSPGDLLTRTYRLASVTTIQFFRSQQCFENLSAIHTKIRGHRHFSRWKNSWKSGEGTCSLDPSTRHPWMPCGWHRRALDRHHGRRVVRLLRVFRVQGRFPLACL